MNTAPVPRFDLLELRHYASVCVQYSRGCPFHCEFCDIIEMFGRVPRVKTAEQMLRELDALHALGYRGTVFWVDDNFIGNRRAVRALLPRIVEWQKEHGRPFEFYTEASVNLAADAELVEWMVKAGFASVFLGIETPSKDALDGAGKTQNARIDVREACFTLSRSGIEPMGGFIVGFDQDDLSIFEAQRRFIEDSPVALAMVGILCALPNTALYRRLAREGRLRGSSDGDQFTRPNFEPRMDEAELLSGYAKLLAAVYSPSSYYRRCHVHLDHTLSIPGGSTLAFEHMIAFGRAVIALGIRSPRRKHFWSLLLKALRKGPGAIRWAVAHALQGEHAIRYTAEHVLPRLERAQAEVMREREREHRSRVRPAVSSGTRAVEAPVRRLAILS
jgi:hypothetical protein